MNCVKDVHIEVSRTRKNIEGNELIKQLNCFIKKLTNDAKGQNIQLTAENSDGLSVYVESISMDDCFNVEDFPDKCNVIYHMFVPNDRPSEIEFFENESGENNEDIPACNHTILPSKEFIGLWESLLYEEGLKENIIKFIETSILFGNRNVNQHIISCNRIILLHGPPGTGKTSLCKAIVQKLSIRMISMFKYTHLIEINSHSLFSKWFSESGKLVMKLFSQIQEMISIPKSLVCVLLDEVESLAYARSSISGNEPRDALRVVNAVLTQLDKIKNYPNVLILTTSNLTSSIDIAFIDRSDIKQFIGYPSPNAIYDIYLSAIKELKRVNIIDSSDEILPYNNLLQKLSENKDAQSNGDFKNFEISLKLLDAVKKSSGFSGRTLRKLPFLAHSLYCNKKDLTIKLEDFIDSLILSINRERWDQTKINEEHN